MTFKTTTDFLSDLILKGQVPMATRPNSLTHSTQNPRYLIIGNGRVARHFEHYFTLLRIPSQSWARKQNSVEELRELHLSSEVTLVLISDSEIEEFIKENSFLQTKAIVHFSGSVTTALAFGAHPLMTFTSSRYDLETYVRIPFICEKNTWSFEHLFPKLSNPHYLIEPNKKEFYHALCVLSGNFTTLLWQKLFNDFETELGLPPEAAALYLEKISTNLLNHPEHALTGPLVRKDIATLQKNIKSLEGDPFQDVYYAFVKTFSPELYKELL